MTTFDDKIAEAVAATERDELAQAQRRAAAVAQARDALIAFRELPGLREAFEALEEAQNATEAYNVWDTRMGHNVERVWGHLQMALEITDSVL